ncbi:hypothetical protein NIASO_01860 [Niabella soli DSM 19437]|uniref:Uncharacterized protein n=1 Tax=Niabella soli DSM 19437 TaxID=929713 RepID=W0F280_9BACT|nr:hypothetical protein NIASO_01860 [Niabella soli DSM 19437]
MMGAEQTNRAPGKGPTGIIQITPHKMKRWCQKVKDPLSVFS